MKSWIGYTTIYSGYIKEEGVHISKLVNRDLTWENETDSKCQAYVYTVRLGDATQCPTWLCQIWSLQGMCRPPGSVAVSYDVLHINAFSSTLVALILDHEANLSNAKVYLA